MLGLRLLEAHGFGEVEYPRWKAACLRERATLGVCAHQAVGHKHVCYATWPSRTSPDHFGAMCSKHGFWQWLRFALLMISSSSSTLKRMSCAAV